MVSLLGSLIPAPHTVGHRTQLEDGGDGPRWADPVNVTGCRVEKTTRQFQTPDSRVVTLTAMTVMPAAAVVQPGDRLVIDGSERTVERVDELVWLNGDVMHREVWTT